MKTNLSFATKTKSVVIVAVVLASITGYYYWTDITSFFMKLWGALPSLVSMNTISLFFAVVIAPLALLLSLYLLIRYINKKWAEIKKIRAEKIKRENEEALFNSLVGLPLSLLALEYMHRCSLLKPDTKETEKKAAEIYLSALIQTAKSGFTLSTDDLIQIVHKISHANYSLGRSFFNLIAGQCLEKGVPELIFSCQNTYFGRLPVLFDQSSRKKKIVDIYLGEEVTRRTLGKLMYSDVKREFKPLIFEGLIRSLVYSYEKSWDEDVLKNLVDRIQKLLNFAGTCFPTLRYDANRNELLGCINYLMIDLGKKGIDVKNPLA